MAVGTRPGLKPCPLTSSSGQAPYLSRTRPGPGSCSALQPRDIGAASGASRTESSRKPPGQRCVKIAVMYWRLADTHLWLCA